MTADNKASSDPQYRPEFAESDRERIAASVDPAADAAERSHAAWVDTVDEAIAAEAERQAQDASHPWVEEIREGMAAIPGWRDEQRAEFTYVDDDAVRDSGRGGMSM